MNPAVFIAGVHIGGRIIIKKVSKSIASKLAYQALDIGMAGATIHMREHRGNKRGSTHDKHTKKRAGGPEKGDKNRPPNNNKRKKTEELLLKQEEMRRNKRRIYEKMQKLRKEIRDNKKSFCFVGTFGLGEIIKSFKKGSGIDPKGTPGGDDPNGGGPGGVEFKKIESFVNFNESNIVLLRKCNIIFECDHEKAVRDAFNSFCLEKFQNRSMKEYFDTIIMEIKEGFMIGESLPFISLHFNKDGLLYSVMHPFYKKTLVGNTLAFLDYFLKGFVNGGFFDAKFVQKWTLNPTININQLNQNLIDVRKELKYICFGYKSLYGILNQDDFGDEFTSAFRIIGEISEKCYISDHNIFPNSEFSVETDVYPTADFQKKMGSEANNRSKYLNILTAHNQMKLIIEQLMPLVPHFEGYFEILRMICFALHYVQSLDSVGLKAETNSAFQNQNESYVNIIPNIFPPLPVRKTININPKITINDLLNELRSTNFGNEMHMILERKSETLTEKTICDIEKRLSSLYKSRIYNQASLLLNYQFLDDNDIELGIFIQTAKIITISMVANFTNILLSLFKNFINDMKEKFNDTSLISQNEKNYFVISDKNLSVSELKTRCQNCLNMISSSSRIDDFVRKIVPDSFKQTDYCNICNNLDQQRSSIFYDLNRSINQHNEIISQLREALNKMYDTKRQYDSLDFNSRSLYSNIQLMQRVNDGINKIPGQIRNLEDEIIDIDREKSRINRDVESKKDELRRNINNLKNELRENERKNIMQIIDKYKQYFQKLEQYYRNPLLIDHLEGTEKCISSDITLSTPVIANGKNGKSIKGGCLIKSSKKCFILNHVLSKETLDIIEDNIIKRNDFVKVSEVHGFLINSYINLINPYDDFIENNEEKYIIRNGLSEIHLYAMLGLIDKIESTQNSKLNEKTLDGISTIYLACCTGNIESIDFFIKKGFDFGEEMQNGMSPFLSIMENGHYNAALHILSNNAKIKNINQCTETEISPLHWAIYYGWSDIVKKLISYGASTTSSIKSNGMNSIHLACLHDQPECLSVLISSPNNYYGLSEAGITPLHTAACHSMICALILIEKKLVDIKIKDSKGHSAKDIAILNGQYEIAKKLPQFTQSISFINNNCELKIMCELNFDSLCYALATGDLLNSEKIIAKFKEQNKQLNSDEEKKLIECACKGRCTEYIELLSNFINLNNCSIPILTACNGIIDWLDELKKYGINLDVQNYQLLDEAVKNADNQFLYRAFEIYEIIPENVMKRIIKKIVYLDNCDMIETLAKQLLFNEKYSNMHFDINEIICQNTSIIAFKLFSKNIIQESIYKLENYIELIPIPLLSYILSTYKFKYEQIKAAIIHAYKKERFDCIYLIINKYSFNYDEIFNIYPELKNITKDKFSIAKNKIEELLLPNAIDENEKISKLKDIFKMTFDIGMLNININYSLLKVAGKKLDWMWIIKALPDQYVVDFCFDKDFIFENKILAAFSYLIEILENRFGKQCGSIFLKSLRNINYDNLDERNLGDAFIEALFKVMSPRFSRSIDDEGKTIFHIAAMFGNLSNQKVIQMIENEKRSWNNLLDIRKKNGETILLSFATKGNINAIKFLEKNGADIVARDIYGNNVLHKLLKAKSITNDNSVEFIYQLGNKYRELFLQRNRNGENPFFLAAKRGFNGILGIMSMFYPAKILDNLDENCKKSSLHAAAEENRFETIRYLVQTLHLDLNIRQFDSSGLMPIHSAAIRSSILAFKEIIKLGGNPLLEDLTGKNSFYYVLAYGTQEMILTITKMATFNYEISSPNILIPLVQNPEASSIMPIISNLFDASSFKICDENGMTLVSLAAAKKNNKIVQELLLLGSDPAKPDNYGRNSIHICAENNSIGCSLIIIENILEAQGFDGVNELLNSSDENGNLPIHIAAENGYDGYISHLLSSCDEVELNRVNHNGYSPINLAIKNGYTKVASIILNWCKLNHIDIDYEKYKLLENEENAKSIAENIEKISLRNNFEDLFNEEEEEKCNESKSIIQIFKDEIKKINILIDSDFLSKFFRVFNNICVVTKLLNMILNGKNDLVKKIIENMKKQRPTKINLIAYTVIFIQLQDNEIDDFITIVNNLNEISLDVWHPLFAWIENGIISSIELRKHSQSVLPFIKSVMNFALRIYQSPILKSVIGYPCIPAPAHLVINWIMKFNEKWIRVQLQFIHLTKITGLLEFKTKLSIDFANRLDYDQYILVNFIMSNKKDSQIIDRSSDFQDYVIHAIYSTLELYEDPNIPDCLRRKLLNKIVEIAKKQKFAAKSLTKWVNGIRRIIEEFGLNYLENILNIIPQESMDISIRAISAILAINSQTIATINLIRQGIIVLEEEAEKAEKKKFSEDRDLDEILNAFKKKTNEFIPYKFAFDGSPIVELNSNELKLLKQLGRRLELQVKIDGSLAEQGRFIGDKFKNNPTIENAADLIAITRIAIQDTLNLKPFIVQCLAVGALLLHRVNKPSNLKGRIAQIATGEGKSIIIAMLSACIALTGNFVDVITSSFYLSKRDSEKFKEFYEKLGLKCGVLHENESKPNTNFHIIYSTNTGFEFAFLREGIHGKKFLLATPLNKNNIIERKPMTSIVDEVDNLFLDTATNSARIADGSSSKLNWIFPPLFKAVSEGKILKLIEVRQFLLKFSNGKDEEESLNLMSDIQLQRLISSATQAIKLKKNVDYVVGFNKLTKELEIQIVDAQNTGRIIYGSRWCGGIHEFVEVKEGLSVKAQSLTIASISHPSFFKRYQEIYGLTGTLGEESERNEIKMIYGVDTFDVPPNRICKRNRTDSLIVSTKEQKHKLIIEKIKEITRSKRPILVIVLSIEESIELSEKLRSEKINHFVLNDQQQEDEDFIIDRAGRCGAVTIATNTAGRGTDIRLDKIANEKGGLHVIIAFHPINMRVECQGLGRAGRQGQQGSCQIIFCSEKYASSNPKASEETMKTVYDERSEKVKKDSEQRMIRVKFEQNIFEILSKYFSFIFDLRIFLERPEGEHMIRGNPDYELENIYDSKSILNFISQKWSEFYSSLLNGDIEIDDNSFELFVKLIEVKIPLISLKLKQFKDSSSYSDYNNSSSFDTDDDACLISSTENFTPKQNNFRKSLYLNDNNCSSIDDFSNSHFI